MVHECHSISWEVYFGFAWKPPTAYHMNDTEDIQTYLTSPENPQHEHSWPLVKKQRFACYSSLTTALGAQVLNVFCHPDSQENLHRLIPELSKKEVLQLDAVNKLSAGVRTTRARKQKTNQTRHISAIFLETMRNNNIDVKFLGGGDKRICQLGMEDTMCVTWSTHLNDQLRRRTTHCQSLMF